MLTDHAWAQRVLCHQTLTQQAMAEGDLDLALLHNGEGMKLARLKGSVLYETMLAVDRVQLLEITGEFERAVGVLDQALLSLRDKVRHSPVLGRLQLVQGQLLAYQGLDEQARAAYQRGRIETEACGDSYAFYGYLGLAELAARSQDYATAYHWLREAERLMQWRHVPEARFRGILQLVTGVAWLHQGELKKARGAFELVAASYEGQAYLAPSASTNCCHACAVTWRCWTCSKLPGAGDRTPAGAHRGQHGGAAVVPGLRVPLHPGRGAAARASTGGGGGGTAPRPGRGARRKLVKPLYELQHRQPQWLVRVLPGSPGSSLHERLQQFGRELEDPGLAAEELVLSNRELTVLKLIAQGCSNQEIAEQLFISLHTVKTHARRINTKLGVARRTQAVARAKALALL